MNLNERIQKRVSKFEDAVLKYGCEIINIHDETNARIELATGIFKEIEDSFDAGFLLCTEKKGIKSSYDFDQYKGIQK